jgi:hypothetical protein
LTDKHLIAEYRELPRIFTLVRRAVERGESINDARNPVEYVLGAGHCRFFYDKLGYLAFRHNFICFEMENRGFKNDLYLFWQDYQEDIPIVWWGDWLPTEAALRLNRARIAERLGN